MSLDKIEKAVDKIKECLDKREDGLDKNDDAMETFFKTLFAFVYAVMFVSVIFLLFVLPIVFGSAY